MKRALLAALIGFAGCNPDSHPPQPPMKPDPCMGVSDCGWILNDNRYVVDPKVAVAPDPGNFAITTDGMVWKLSWLGANMFSGAISCPFGCQITYAHFAGNYGFADPAIAGNQVSFTVQSLGTGLEVLEFAAPQQPLEFDLAVDGSAAIGEVVFSSQGILSTTDHIPFQLYDSSYVE